MKIWSNGKIFINFPISTSNIELIQIFLLVVPANSIKGIFYLENHSAERSNSWQISTSFNCFVICIVNEACICPVLSVKSAENKNWCLAYLVWHRQITRNPCLFISYINDFPNIFLDIICFTNICNLLRRKLDSSTKNINEFGIEYAASCWVSGNIEFCHSDPFINTDVIVFTCLVKVLCIISSDNVNPIFFRFIDRSEIWSWIIEIWSVL